MLLQDDYRITLDAFEGPLDLLLYLVRRAEVDVQDIPIARITDQYLALLARLNDIDVEAAGEFLVMAATLIEVKSRTLAPPAQEPDGQSADVSDAPVLDVTDPRRELIEQLLTYQRLRVAVEMLEERREEFSHRFSNRPGRLPKQREDAEGEQIELEDAHILDLSESYERIVASIDFTRLGDHSVEFDDTPIELYEADLIDRLHRRADGRLTLQDAFSGHNRSQRIGLFLALLELVRLRQVTVLQPQIEGRIEVLLQRDPEPQAPEPNA